MSRLEKEIVSKGGGQGAHGTESHGLNVDTWERSRVSPNRETQASIEALGRGSSRVPSPNEKESCGPKIRNKIRHFSTKRETSEGYNKKHPGWARSAKKINAPTNKKRSQAGPVDEFKFPKKSRNVCKWKGNKRRSDIQEIHDLTHSQIKYQMGDITLEARTFSGRHFCVEVQKNSTICKWLDYNIKSRLREMIPSPVGKQGILLQSTGWRLHTYTNKNREKRR